MRTPRVVAATALIAASAIVFAACSSSPEQPDNTSGSDASTSQPTADQSTAIEGTSAAATDPADSGTDAATETDTDEAADGTGLVAPPGATGEVGGSACGAPHGPYDDLDADLSGTVTVGIDELAQSLNSDSSHGNATSNADALYIMNGPGLFYYNDKSELINNDSFGICTLDSLDPLTVTYTLSPDAMWSDGVPVTAADLLLNWAAGSGHYNTAPVEYDGDGTIVPSAEVAFESNNPGAALITDFPKISDDGKSMTVTYSEFFADYTIALDIGVPAHVVALHALGPGNAATDAASTDTAATATANMVSLLKDTLDDGKDVATDQQKQLKAVADFWNTGFDATALPSDASLAISHGPYVLTDWKQDQHMTFEANPDYTWGPKPRAKTIEWTYVPDPTTAIKALGSGDVDIINPKATADVKSSLEELADAGVEAITISSAAYEHIDLVFDNGGPFTAAAYDGNEATALAVRQAFLHTIPRQGIVDTLIKPLNDNAVLRQAFTMFPGQDGYDAIVAENGSADYADAGSDKAIAKAKQLLADVGVAAPINVRFLYADDSPRRMQEYKLVAASAAKAGFHVIDGANAQWSSLLGETSAYDAALFAWQPTTPGVSEVTPNYLCKDNGTGVTAWGQNNLTRYCSTVVNKALTDLSSQSDVDKRFDDLMTTDKNLWADGFGTTLYQLPDIVAYNTNAVTGVSDAPSAPTFLWNLWEWAPTGHS